MARPHGESSTRQRLHVAIGQFHRLLSLGLWVALSEDRSLHIVGEDFDYEELLQLVREPRPPAVVILDASRTGVAAIRGLRIATPTVGLLLLVPRHEHDLTTSLLEAGATECVFIETTPDDLRRAVRRTARQSDMTPDSDLQRNDTGIVAHALAELTVREREVLALLVEGRSRSVIAVSLHIAEGTVDTHVKRIYRKLGVKSRVEVRHIALPPQ